MEQYLCVISASKITQSANPQPKINTNTYTLRLNKTCTHIVKDCRQWHVKLFSSPSQTIWHMKESEGVGWSWLGVRDCKDQQVREAATYSKQVLRYCTIFKMSRLYDMICNIAKP